MTTGATERPGPSRKAIIGWAIAMLAVLGLVTAIGAGWPSIRLSYYVHKLETTTTKDLWNGTVTKEAYVNWLLQCHDAALEGNPRAMRAVMTPLRRKTLRRELSSCFFVLVLKRPDPFFDVLGGQSRKDIFLALDMLNRECWATYHHRSGRRRTVYVSPGNTPAAMLASFQVWERCGNPQVEKVASRVSIFLKEYFSAQMEPKAADSG